MNTTNKLNKRPIVLLLILAILIVAVLAATSYSLVTIESNSNADSSVYISRSDGESSDDKNFKLNNSKKTFLIKKGDYKIDVLEDNKQSIYHREFKGFSKNTLIIETEAQKNTFALGEATFNCNNSSLISNVLIYYPCDNYAGTIERRTGDNIETLLDPLYESLAEDVHAEDTSTNNNSGGPNPAFTPYKDGFISLAIADGQVNAQLIGATGQPDTGSTASIGEPSNSQPGSYHFAAAKNKASEVFALFNSDTKLLYIYKNLADKNPKKINLSDIIGETPEGLHSYDLLIGKSTVFLVVSSNQEGIEGQITEKSEEELSEESKKAKKDQKVIIVPVDNLSAVERDLPDNFVVDQTTVSENDNLLITPLTPNDYAQMLTPDNKLNQINLSAGEIDSYCWLGDDSVYYNLLSESKIYKYSASKQASFLVYETQSDEIANLNCNFSELGFTLNSPRRASLDKLAHYRLVNKPVNGIRLDGILPITHTFNGDTYDVEDFQGRIVVKLEYDSGGNGPSPQTVVEAEIKKLLAEQGVEASSLKFDHRY